MKHLAAFAVAAALVPTAAHTVRADVSWEHKGSIKVSSLPMSLVDIKTYTSYAPGKTRLLIKYHSPFIPTKAIPASTWKEVNVPPQLRLKKITGTGSLGMVQNIADDRLLAWESQTGASIDESFIGTMRHVIVDPFEKTDPSLSKEEIPDLSEAQRQRLGREIRAYLKPVTKRFTRTYFRALDEKRTIAGVEGHGFRLTQLFFLKPTDKDQVKISAEWWLAGDLPGDDTIRELQTQALDKLKAIGYPSKSMWGRELPYVLLNAFPEETLSALHTFAPGENFTGFGGTPLEMNLTIVPPISAGGFGDIHAQLSLVKRSEDTIPERVFQVPAGYKKVDMAPLWKQYDKMRDEGSLEGILQKVEKTW